MATALTGVLTRPVAQIVASFMEFAPGVRDTDVLLRAMMLKIRKKSVDDRDCIISETRVRACEKYEFNFEVLKRTDLDDDDDVDLSYSLEGKEIHGWMTRLTEGVLDPRPWDNWIRIDYVIKRPAAPQGFRDLRSELLDLKRRVEKVGVCPTAPGRRACEEGYAGVRYVCAEGSKYCVNCCVHLAFRDSDVP